MIEHTRKDVIGHLLMHVCRTRSKTADQFMEHNKLHRGQGFMLLFVSENDGLSHSEIAEKIQK